MNIRAIKQWIARTILFMSSESAGQMLRNFRRNLAIINDNRSTTYGLFLLDWNVMLSDENNLEKDKPYFTEKTGYGTDAKAICLYKKGSDGYVILDKCLYDTKKDANGYRKEYWGNKIDDYIVWFVLGEAIQRYNDSLVKNILKSGEEYVAVASKERGLSVWIARDKNGELCLYKSKPCRCGQCFDFDEVFMPMDEDMYPEITWENSPKEFELKAVEI